MIMRADRGVRNTRGRKRERLGYYGEGAGWTPIHDELKACDAYRILSATERLVLLAWIRVYHKASGADMTELEDGFEYVWAVCDEDVSEGAFYRARKRICLLGFFEQPPDIQSLRPGAPARFTPSREWLRYRATGEEAKAIARHNKTKKDRLRRAQRRRTKFRAEMGSDKNRKGMSK